jgi:hypothetical protein
MSSRSAGAAFSAARGLMWAERTERGAGLHGFDGPPVVAGASRWSFTGTFPRDLGRDRASRPGIAGPVEFPSHS